MHLFPDTHFFLHYRHPSEIPWAEATDADTIRLIVGKAVPKELDKKKFELRGWPQRLAKTWVKTLGEIAELGGEKVIRENGPRVVLGFSPGHPVGWTAPAELEPNWGDDVLIADVLAFRSAVPDAKVAVLTSDPGLLAKARTHGIPVIGLARFDWERPEETTPEQKELEQLRRENEQLKRVGPAVSCGLEVRGGPEDGIQLDVVRHPPLTDDVVDELLSELRTRHPKAVEAVPPTPHEGTSRIAALSDRANATEWKAPTPEEMAAYSAKYDRWLDDVSSFIRAAPEAFEVEHVAIDFELIVQNTGSSSATGVEITIEVTGDWLLHEINGAKAASTDRDAVRRRPATKFRSAPTPPTFRRVPKPLQQLTAFSRLAFDDGVLSRAGVNRPELSIAGRALLAGGQDLSRSILQQASIDKNQNAFNPVLLDHAMPAWAEAYQSPDFLPPPRPEPRNPRSFYRTTSSVRIGTRVGYVCEEFRHQLEARVFQLRLMQRRGEDTPRSGTISVSVSASNTRELYRREFPVHVRVTDADVRQLVADLLP